MATGVARTPEAAAPHERTTRLLRAALGPDALAAARDAGRALGLEEAIAEARQVVPTSHLPARRPPGPSVGTSPDREPSGAAARAGLTPREVEVLRLLIAGRSNPQIAATLGVSARTAAAHVSNILAKLGVSTRVAAVAWAARNGVR